MASLSVLQLLLLSICLFIAYSVLLVFYHLLLSPLAKFPGPTLAAGTFWYEFYYDVVKRGRYTWEIADMHARYGAFKYDTSTVAQQYYDELYVGHSTRRTLKYKWLIRGFGPTISAFSTPGHELHRLRRSAIAPFFSKTMVQQMEPLVQAMVDKLLARIETFRGTGGVINLIDMYPCLTSDVICQYAFASPYGYLDEPEFAPLWHKANMDAGEVAHFFKQFQWLETLMRKLPTAVVARISPSLASLFLMNDMVREKIQLVQTDIRENKGEPPRGQKTIFHELFANEQLPPEEKTAVRLEAEGVILVAAGSGSLIQVSAAHVRLIQ
ncbi:MAG: hypothetical protein Q9222_003934 [Ikaeria aurantiellina]